MSTVGEPLEDDPLVDAIARADPPVLRSTIVALNELERNIDRVSGSQLAQAILRDPMMTLRVIRFLMGHRSRSQTQDITTIAHALMMLGLARFFREFRSLTAVEDVLRGNPAALSVVLAAAARARQAALFARELAQLRHDVDPEEVIVAAMLHDIGEIVVRTAAQGAPAGGAVQPPDAAALRALQRRLFQRWGLPGLLVELMDDRNAERPRVQTVTLACRLARDTAYGWQGPRVADDFKRIQRLLHVSLQELHERSVRACLTAAREWRLYGVRPAAYYWPMLPEKHA